MITLDTVYEKIKEFSKVLSPEFQQRITDQLFFSSLGEEEITEPTILITIDAGDILPPELLYELSKYNVQLRSIDIDLFSYKNFNIGPNSSNAFLITGDIQNFDVTTLTPHMRIVFGIPSVSMDDRKVFFFKYHNFPESYMPSISNNITGAQSSEYVIHVLTHKKYTLDELNHLIEGFISEGKAKRINAVWNLQDGGSMKYKVVADSPESSILIGTYLKMCLGHNPRYSIRI